MLSFLVYKHITEHNNIIHFLKFQTSKATELDCKCFVNAGNKMGNNIKSQKVHINQRLREQGGKRLWNRKNLRQKYLNMNPVGFYDSPKLRKMD